MQGLKLYTFCTEGGGGSNLKDCTEFSALGPSTDLDLVGFAGLKSRGSFLEEELLIVSCTPYNIYIISIYI